MAAERVKPVCMQTISSMGHLMRCRAVPAQRLLIDLFLGQDNLKSAASAVKVPITARGKYS